MIDKPAGPTSHDIVQRVKRILRADKVGHLGTLDPAATGVLPLCINKATKQAQYISEGDKIYSFKLVLGKSTDTDDDQGEVVEERDVCDFHQEKLPDVVRSFIGEVEQVPPQYCARKVGGKRMYKLVRKGIKVEAQPKKVRITDLKIEKVNGNIVDMIVRCGSGTYVRALCRDIGNVLGCKAHASSIRRLKSGRFTIDQAVKVEDLEGNWEKSLISM